MEDITNIRSNIIKGIQAGVIIIEFIIKIFVKKSATGRTNVPNKSNIKNKLHRKTKCATETINTHQLKKIMDC